MASTLKHLRSSTADKRPVASGLADGQFAINTASGTPGVFFKDSNGGVVKVGPTYVGATAPNAVPAGSAGNSLGELWVNDDLATPGLNYYTGSTFVNLTPSGTTTTVGLVELATPAETQTGADGTRAVTPSGLQSKVSDSTSTTSSTTIASSTAVKSAYDLADAALPKAGGTLTGELLIGNAGSLVFEGSTNDGFETTIAVVDPTADRTITFPNITGTVVTTGDSGTVTSTMIANSTIVNTDISASAAIAGTKVSPNFGGQTITTSGVISAALGTAATPSIAFTGDLNTGIYSPGADQLAFSTGGTGRLFVDASGNVGVGSTATSTAARLLDVNGGALQPLFLLRASNATSATTEYTLDTVNSLVSFISSDWPIRYYINGSERLRITSAGLVGLGTSSPSFLLDALKSSAGTVGRFQANGTDSNISIRNSGREGIIGSDTTQSYLLNTDAFPWTFWTNNTERLRITSVGLVGIGTSAPSNTAGFSQQLELAGSLPCISINQTNAGFTTRKYSLGADSVGGLGIWDNNVSAYRFYINTSGQVGIGTTSPARTLSVYSTSAIPVDIESSGNDNALRLVTAGGSAQICGIQNSSGNLVLNASGSERARIDSSGRLLVGTSTARTGYSGNTPEVQIEAAKASDSVRFGLCNNSNGVQDSQILLAKTRGTSVGSNTIVQDGDTLGRIQFLGADGTDLEAAAQILAQVDGTPGNNDMPGRLVFSTTADGASSPTERMRIDNTGLTTCTHANQNTVLSAESTNASFVSTCLRLRTSRAAGTSCSFIYGEANSVQAFSVYNNGNVQNTNNSYGALSDSKLKENIVNATSQWSDIKALQVRKYNFKEGQTHTQIGLIAQEVELVSPGLVSESPDRDADGNDLGTVTKSVNYSVLYMKAVKALQEAMERIETLEAKVAALEQS